VKERLSKILGLVLFVFLIVTMISLSFKSSGADEKSNFSGIEITGNKLLSADDYLGFSGFDDSTSLQDITLPLIKVRFEKHPYIIKADVEFDGEKKILVELKERNFMAVVFENQKFSLLTDNYEKVPVFNNTEFYELPIITNLKAVRKNEDAVPEHNKDLVQALKIIDALKFCDEEMYSRLAEINLHKGGDVILTFTDLEYPVIFGRGNEAAKVLALKAVWNEIKSSNNIYSNLEYLDLRFSEQILIGKKEKT